MPHATRSDFVTLRAGGRTWLVGPRHFHGLVQRFSAGRRTQIGGLEREPDLIALRRLHGRFASPRDAGKLTRNELTAWLRWNLERGRLVALDITAKGAAADVEVLRRDEHTLRFPGPLTGAPAVGSFTTDLARFSMRDRCAEALLRVDAHLPVGLRKPFDDHLHPKSLAAAVAAMLRWSDEFGEGVSPTMDASLLARAYDLSGWGAFWGLAELAHGLKTAHDAVSDAMLDQAAAHLAKGIEHLGVHGFMTLTALAAVEAKAQRTAVDETVHRWAYFLEAMQLDPTVGERTAVWGAIGERGELRAEELARREDRMTFSRAFGATDFPRRFLAEFGPANIGVAARRVWELAGRRFLGLLRGEVVLYVDPSRVGGTTPGAPAFPARPVEGASNEALRKQQDFEAKLSGAGAGSDLELLTKMAGLAVSEVTVVDVMDPANRFKRALR